MRRVLRLLVASLLFMFLLPPALLAQERTITGTVLADDNKTPLSGVTVVVKGTDRKTMTDASGNFTIRINAGQTLQFTYVGHDLREVKPDGNSVSISLKASDATLGEVVVTAMDIKRNPRELGYSVQKVNGDEIKESQRDNFLNSLQGRVAGLTINQTSGLAGASSSIVLRGFNSMALDNQPLFVIDGVISDNQTINQTSNSNSGLGLVESGARNVNETSNRQGDYTNRIGDINPNDIESITVLKGPEATALYGSQASSGAIIITTKKGRNDGMVRVNYDNAFRMSKLTRFPETQNVYGNGVNGVTSSEFRYFGAKYPENTRFYDNMGNFFKNAFSQTHNLSADYGKKDVTFRLSGSFLDQSGTVPENKYQRVNLRLSNSTKIGKYIELTPSISYIRSTNNKPLRGQNGYMLNLLIYPENYDARNWQNDQGGKNLIFNSSANGELDNPYFSVYRNRGYDKTNRYLATMGININPFDWLTVSGRFGYDTYTADGYTVYHPLSFILARGTGGSMDNYYRKYTGYNHTITATAKKTVGKWGFRFMGGTMWQDYKTEMYSVYGTNLVDSVNSAGLMVRNNEIISQQQFEQWIGDSSATRATSRLRLNNARKGIGYPNFSINRQVAYFGEAAVSFNNYIFFSYTHRFETSSIFPKDYRNYNYPAGSLSVIVSDILPSIKAGNVVNYLKVRSSLASTARSSAPYRNQSVFNPAVSSGGGFAYGFDNNNFFLEPEIQKTYEIGTELRMFKSKLSLDITYYNTLCEKQIFEGFRASYGTGYVLNTLNIGTTRNKGVEVSLNMPILSKRELGWDMRVNFNKMWNKVVLLPANVSEVYLSDTWPYLNARGGLVMGGPTTSITAFGYQRNSAGKILIDPANGLPLSDGLFKVRGDRNPDFAMGWLNSFTYKNWRLNFLWDLKVGGDIFNATEQYLTINGKSKRTLDRETPRVIDGVLKDGKENTASPTPNTIVVTPMYSSTYYFAANMPDEAFIEKDVNWFRMRDITLSYSFSPNSIKRFKSLKSLGFFVTATDLILFTNYNGADPSVSANSAGVRGVGGWGFDYGNAGSPISVNFGLRAGF
ncbi:MAG: SusC/RagA family TonB-linked outer membrane protein [Chitinophagaceae bacterium]